MERRGEVFDGEGNLLEDEVIVPDGGHVLVPMQFADGRMVLRYGDDGHPRPGRLFVDQNSPSELAYLRYKQNLSQAYLQKPPPVCDASETSRRREVQSRFGPIPPAVITDADIAQSQQRCAQAHAKYVDGLAGAWQKVQSL